MTVDNSRNELGKINKVRKWVSHKLTGMQMHQRLITCMSLSSRQNKKSFLHKIVTGNESCVYYENQMKRKYTLDP